MLAPSTPVPTSTLPIASSVGANDRVVLLRPDEPLDKDKLATVPASLLTGETAALLTADASTGTLTYEAPRNLTTAQVESLGLAVITAATTTHALLLNVTSVYDSQTGELAVTLPASPAPADILSVHLYRTIGAQEHMLSETTNPFGGRGSSLPTRNLLDLTPAFMNAVLALTYTDCDADPAASPAGSFPGQQFDAKYNGHNCHFYCTRGTYDPAAAAGTTGQGPAWHYTVKQA